MQRKRKIKKGSEQEEEESTVGILIDISNGRMKKKN